MDFIRNLTVNQGIALLVFVVVVLVIAAVIFGISQQETDPFSVPTPTLQFSQPNTGFQFVQPTATP